MKMDLMKKKKKKGFTLIELIVVIAIIGILAMIAVPKLSGFQDKARRTQVVTDAHQITTAIESLLTESANGKIAAQSVIDITDANINGAAAVTANPVLKMAGIAPAETGQPNKTLLYGDDGSFTLTEVLNKIEYTATRLAGKAAVIKEKAYVAPTP